MGGVDRGACSTRIVSMASPARLGRGCMAVDHIIRNLSARLVHPERTEAQDRCTGQQNHKPAETRVVAVARARRSGMLSCVRITIGVRAGRLAVTAGRAAWRSMSINKEKWSGPSIGWHLMWVMNAWGGGEGKLRRPSAYRRASRGRSTGRPGGKAVPGEGRLVVLATGNFCDIQNPG